MVVRLLPSSLSSSPRSGAVVRFLGWWFLLLQGTITITLQATTIEAGGIPTEPEFFALQFVNHNRVPSLSSVAQTKRRTTSSRLLSNRTVQSDNEATMGDSSTSLYWKQRFYRNSDHFQGPGHPILLILGGESAIPPSMGIFYPVVVNVYAKAFGALVLEPEHRFYGASQPLSIPSQRIRPDPRVGLLTAEQALQDAMRLTQHFQESYGCSLDRMSPLYCPVVTIGGSYPGFLSAMARLRFPHVVDMAYAASAPMKFYAQQVDQYAYYHHITTVAEHTVPGCASSVQETLGIFVDQTKELNSVDELVQVAQELGICPESIPTYLLHDATTFLEELLMVVGYTFANHNMAHYPPSNQTSLAKACYTFLSTTMTPMERLGTFLVQSLHGARDKDRPCVHLTQELPAGANATLSGGDWSGVGSGGSGESWDFQTCTLLVEAIGFAGGSSDMFPPRPWSMEWMDRHCQARFGVSPQPYKLVQEWGYDDLVHKTNASHILFTNGLIDGWSVSGIQYNLSDTLVALNFPNGAHHSDLWKDDVEANTPDIVDGFRRIQQLLGEWLEDLPSYRLYNKSAVVALPTHNEPTSSEKEGGLRGGSSVQ